MSGVDRTECVGVLGEAIVLEACVAWIGMRGRMSGKEKRRFFLAMSF